MSDVGEVILRKVREGDWQVTSHALRRMSEKGIAMTDVFEVTGVGAVIETNRGDHLGPSVLICGKTKTDLPLHVLWGIVRDESGPAYLVTAYWPDPDEWTQGFTVRKTK